MSDPVDNIVWVEAVTLRSNFWNPNRVMIQEMRLLEHSLVSTGWIQPLLINRNNMIIDGFHRWRLAQDSKVIQERWKGRVPVSILDVDDDVAMAITVRINRAKGVHVAIEMHKLVTSLVKDWEWDRKRIAKEIGAPLAEVDVLLQSGVFSTKNIKNHAYSNAWYPAESKDDVVNE
jgi:ParB-like chromosome segregation protein Spo0J